MSTKIYYAYRMPTKLFRPVFLPAFREHVFKTAAAFVKDGVKTVDDKELKAEWRDCCKYDKKLTLKKFMKERAAHKRVALFFRRAVEASKGMQRSFDCIDCSLNCWIYKNYVYVILYGEHWLWDGFQKHAGFTPPEGVENYCYWNNTDEPDDVTRRQWEARGKTWDKVCLNNWDEARMTHEIIKADSTTHTGLFEVAKIVFNGDDDKATGAVFGI